MVMDRSGCSRAVVALRAALGAALIVAIGAPVASAQPEGSTLGDLERREVEIVVGEQLAIPTEGVSSFSEGVKGVVDFKRAKENPTNFVLLGLAPGTTSLLLIMRDGRQILYAIRVVARQRGDAVYQRDNIRLDFYFVELSSGGSYQVGLVWPGTTPDSGQLGATIDLTVNKSIRPRSITTATAAVTSQVLPRLDLAENAGWARVLRHASLTMTNGETGSFGSGGEVNVRVGNGLAVGLEQIEHGTRIKVTPRYDAETGRIDVRIAAEVATLAAGGGVDGLPGRNVTTVDTAVNLELGNAIVLGGLVGESRAKETVGIPVLSQIPVLGYLFGRRAQSRERRENVVVIVPTVIDAVEKEDRRLVEDALDNYRGFSGSFRGRPLQRKKELPR